MSFSRRARWLAAALLLVTVAGGDDRAPAPRRIFHLDLKSLGAVGLVIPWSGDYRKPIPPGLPESVAFLDGSTLAVSFPISTPRTDLSAGNKSRSDNHLFHTTLIDLPSARVVAETSWGTAHDEDAVLALPRGRLLVRSGDRLAVVSREWKQEREYALPQPGPEEFPARVSLSPSGQTVFVVRKAGEHREQVEELSSESLTQLHAFTIESVGLDAGSDSYFAYALPGKKGNAVFVLPLSALGKGDLPRLQPLYFTQQEVCNHPYLVTDDRLVLTGLCNSLTLIAADGSVRAQQGLGHFSFVAEATSSQDQRHFAVPVVGGILPGPTQRMSSPLRVYETQQLSVVSELVLWPQFEDSVPLVHYALSADGSLLAVMYGFDLSVYQLSASTPAPGVASPSPPGAEASPKAEPKLAAPPGVQPGPAIAVAANVLDLGHNAIEVWVQVSNHGTTEVALAPEQATLDIVSPVHKTLAALKPDKLAFDIKRVGQVDADYEWNTRCDFLNPYADCGPAGSVADGIRQDAEATAADVEASALRAQVLKPGEQVQGAIFFTYQKRRGESVLRLPIGDQVFEFRFPPQKPEKK